MRGFRELLHRDLMVDIELHVLDRDRDRLIAAADRRRGMLGRIGVVNQLIQTQRLPRHADGLLVPEGGDHILPVSYTHLSATGQIATSGAPPVIVLLIHADPAY